MLNYSIIQKKNETLHKQIIAIPKILAPTQNESIEDIHSVNHTDNL
jgi:hypothetical protein